MKSATIHGKVGLFTAMEYCKSYKLHKYDLNGNPCLDQKLPRCKAQKNLKPKLQLAIRILNFFATPQMGDFSFKH